MESAIPLYVEKNLRSFSMTAGKDKNLLQAINTSRDILEILFADERTEILGLGVILSLCKEKIKMDFCTIVAEVGCLEKGVQFYSCSPRHFDSADLEEMKEYFFDIYHSDSLD
jgi:hypothetical protein